MAIPIKKAAIKNHTCEVIVESLENLRPPLAEEDDDVGDDEELEVVLVPFDKIKLAAFAASRLP